MALPSPPTGGHYISLLHVCTLSPEMSIFSMAPEVQVGAGNRLSRSWGEGNGYPLQYSCLGNPMDRGAWLAAVRGVAKSWTRLSA